MSVDSNRVGEQMVQKLTEEKRQLSKEIAKLKKEMNTLTMVISTDPDSI